MSKTYHIQPFPEEGRLTWMLEAVLQQGPPWKVDGFFPLLSYPYVNIRFLGYKVILQAFPDTVEYFEQALQDRSRYIQGLALGLLLMSWSPDRERLVSEYLHKTNKYPLDIGEGPIASQYIDLLNSWIFARELPTYFVSHVISLIVKTGALSKHQLRDYIWHERYAVRVPAIDTAIESSIDISDDLREGLNHNNDSVVLSCIYGLVQLADKRDTETFFKLTVHSDSRFQKAAFKGLGKLDSPAARTFLYSQIAKVIGNS